MLVADPSHLDSLHTRLLYLTLTFTLAHSVLTSSGAQIYHHADPSILDVYFHTPLLMSPSLKSSLPQETVPRLQS
ncbi:hypothetical protein BDR03DRAFT_47432 [Suillus americanus]|nr:hypothetical protein BDR03DRAFT_47432 [Suillus americanus]